jgi:hypothetical protein
MRRVYYTYAIRAATLPGVPQGFLMLASIVALSYFVSIGNVIANLMQAPVGHLGVFFYNAVTNTEAWTLLLLGVFIFCLFSLRFKVWTFETPRFSGAKG